MGKFNFYIFTPYNMANTKLENHLDFIKAQVYSFLNGRNRSDNIYDIDDLHQEGCLAFMYAADTYNPVRGEFKSYAATVIRRKLQDYWRVITKRGTLCEVHYNEYEDYGAFLDKNGCLAEKSPGENTPYNQTVENEIYQKFDRMIEQAYANETSKVIRIGLEYLYEIVHGNVNARQKLIQKYSNLGKTTKAEMEISKSLKPEEERQFTLTSNYISIAKIRALKRLDKYGLNEFVDEYLRRE